MSPLTSFAAFWRREDGRSAREVEAEILEELRFHLEMSARDGEQAGLDSTRARAEAVRRFGSFAGAYQDCRRTQIGGRLMLQRVTTALVLFLLVAVVAQALLMRHVQARSSQDMRLLANELTLLRASLQPASGLPPAVQAGPPEAPVLTHIPTHKEALIAEVRAGNSQAVARALADNPPAMEALFALLRSSQVALAARVQAAEILGELGASDDPDQRQVVEVGARIRSLEAASEAQAFDAIVDPNGVVRLPEVGFVHVAGLTWPETELLIRRRYQEFFIDPSIALDMPSWRFQPLIDALDDPVPEVAEAAARALALIDNPRSQAALQEVSTNPFSPASDAWRQWQKNFERERGGD